MAPTADTFRELFMLDPDVAFLNRGSFGAVPRSVFEFQNRLPPRLGKVRESIRYQIAQKLHACTAPPPEGRDENLRFHDLIDLILLRGLVADDGWPAVRDACLDTFQTRGMHSWPSELIVYPSWPAAFAALAEDQGFDNTDVEEAARQVREMIERINAATDRHDGAAVAALSYADRRC